MAELEVAGAPSGFRIRNEHFVSEMSTPRAPRRPQRDCGRVLQHQVLQGSDGGRRGSIRRRWGSRRVEKGREKDRLGAMTFFVSEIAGFRIRNCRMRLDMRDLTIRYICIQFMFFIIVFGCLSVSMERFE